MFLEEEYAPHPLERLSESPYRQLYSGSTFLAVGEVHGPQRKALVEAQKDLEESGITLEHIQTLSQGIKSNVREVFVLRQEGGIVDRRGQLITVCTRDYIRDVLLCLQSIENPPDLNVAGYAALSTAQELLAAGTGRVVITSADRVIQEIDDWRGAGTLAYDPRYLKKRPLQEPERPVVRMVMEDLIASGHFRAREDEEEILQYHDVIDIKGVLAGVSRLNWGEGNTEFARWWTGHPGNELGCQAGAYAIEEWRKSDSHTLYALTKHARRGGKKSVFEKLGFSSLGKVRDIQGDNSLPQQIQTYDVPGRNPEVYRIVK